MATDIWDSLIEQTDAVVLDQLGKDLTYWPKGGAPVSVRAIFERPFATADVGRAGVGGSSPYLFLRRSALAAKPVEGDRVLIPNDATGTGYYRVIDPVEPDGQGGMRLPLRMQDPPQVYGHLDASAPAARCSFTVDHAVGATFAATAPAASGYFANELLITPALFGYAPPFSLFRRTGVLSTSFLPASLKPAYTRTIYVGAGGNNASDGLTYPNRVRSLKIAISKANAFAGETVRLLVDPGSYKKSNVSGGNADSWDGFNPTVSLVIEVNGPGYAINLQDVTMPAFVDAGLGSNIYRSAYTTQNPTRSIIDATALDELGQPSRVWPVLNVASAANPAPELNAAWANGWGASWVDTVNKFVYVRRADNSAPDANIIVLTGASGALLTNIAGASLTVWMERMRHWCPVPFKLSGAAGITPLVVADDCDFNFSNSADGYGWSGGGGNSYLYNSRTRWNDRDGANYHGIGGDAFLAASSVRAHEFYCNSSWNGWDGTGTNNGSTAHDGCAVVSLASVNEHNADRSTNDINNARRWMAGPRSGSRRGADASEASAGYAAGFAAQTYASRLFLDTATVPAGANQHDLEAYDGCAIYLAQVFNDPSLTQFTVGTGLISTYAP